MRATGAIPAPSCSYQEYLEYGAACVGINGSGVILGGANSGARISGLGASLMDTRERYPATDRAQQLSLPGVVNIDVRLSKRTPTY